MAKVDVYKIDGSKSGIMELPDNLFSVKVDGNLIYEAIRIQDANSRTTLASVKDRSEVRGGGRKPWKQKGTGRARHGSRRSPIWKGGGVTFGPLKMKNFGLKINKKARRKALASILSDKVANESFIVVDDYGDLKGRTKYLSQIRKVLPGSNSSALFITLQSNDDIVKASRNLDKTSTISAQSLNVRDLAKCKTLIASKDAINKIIEIYS